MPTKKTAAKTASKPKAVAKKAPVKKLATKRSASTAHVHHRSFMQAKFTEQTIYWLIIGAAVVALAAWVLSLQVQLNEMYDAIETSSSSSIVTPDKQEL
ncbi:MAG: hypothetical protein ABIQ64_02980 [Candidatus Saccharimonadales bacterium]